MELVVHREDSESKGAYYVESEGKRVAEMTFSKAGTDRIIIDHTQVDDEFRGSKLGEMMVHKAVDDARASKISIVPLCPFARSVFNKNETLRDVL